MFFFGKMQQTLRMFGEKGCFHFGKEDNYFTSSDPHHDISK